MFWLSCQPIPFGFLGMCLVIQWPMLRTTQLAARATHGLFSCFITPWSRSWNRRWSCPRVAIHRSCRASADTGLRHWPTARARPASGLDRLTGQPVDGNPAFGGSSPSCNRTSSPPVPAITLAIGPGTGAMTRGAAPPPICPAGPWSGFWGLRSRPRNLLLQSGIADPEHLAGEAVAMVAEQVRDDVCDPVGRTWPADLERHRVDRDAAFTQL